jgi:putative transposase
VDLRLTRSASGTSRDDRILTRTQPPNAGPGRDLRPQDRRKRQRRLDGVDELVLTLTAKGLTTGEVSAHLAEVYGAEVSRDTISNITDRVLVEMADWQSRPLDPIYPVVFIDAIHVKIRDGKVANRPIYTAVAVTSDGERDLYTAPTEPAAKERFVEFTATWGERYPGIVRPWENAWSEFVPFLAFEVEVRRVILSTNAVESLNARFRRAVRAHGHVPSDQAALKCLYLTLRSLDPTGQGRQRWPIRWRPALNAFALMFEGRIIPSQ